MSQANYPTPANPESKAVSTWRKVLAAILDFITVFALGGYVIASFTGDTSGAGFELNGGRHCCCSPSSSSISRCSAAIWAARCGSGCSRALRAYSLDRMTFFTSG